MRLYFVDVHELLTVNYVFSEIENRLVYIRPASGIAVFMILGPLARRFATYKGICFKYKIDNIKENASLNSF